MLQRAFPVFYCSYSVGYWTKQEIYVILILFVRYPLFRLKGETVMPQKTAKQFINDFTTGPVLRTLLTFTFPLFLSNLLQAVYSMVDMIVVGRVVGETGLSGVTIGGDILAFLTFISMGFSSASQVIISQYIGAGLKDKLSRFIGTMASSLILCAVGLSVIALFLREHILTWLNTPAESWDQALAYATTCMCGLVFIYGYNIVGAVMRGLGDSKRPFLFIAIASVLNLILDILFVAVFRWEAFGAALATVIAQGVSFLTALFYLYHRRDRFDFAFSRSNFRIDLHELSVLIKLGVPFAIRSASIMFSRLFVSSWINSYGVTVSAVTGVGNKVNLIANLMGTAVTTAGSSMVGQNIGAEKYGRVRRILGSAFLINGICFSVLIAVIILFPRSVFGLFTADANVLALCLEYVIILVVTFVASALRDSMNAFTSGCGNYKFNFAVAIIDGLITRIGLSLLFGLGLSMGYFGFWLGDALSGSMPFVLGSIYYLSGWWKKKSAIVADT